MVNLFRNCSWLSMLTLRTSRQSKQNFGSNILPSLS
ncbi:unnamed protein product [Musa acuminata subsp. malaccensis]|uniref:(wild Malaysian banana) hypothetical protein n=1 Tax=Musa acuminata subsp. malaccensis TaxID=214687 RepID=A0A804I113_MUSAM|nr:unnamed protein product [Musa acuminata subsp. malaccensis]